MFKKPKLMCLIFVGLQLSLISFLATVGWCQTPSTQVIKWRLQGIHAQGDIIFATVQETCDLIKKMSQGRREITPSPSGQIVPAGEVANALNKGVFEMTESYGGYFAGIVGEIANIESGPLGVYLNPQDFEALYYEMGWLKSIQDAYSKKNFYFLGVAYDVADTIFSVKKPIDKVEKLKNLKFRSSGMTAKSLSAAGAKVVFLPFEECFSAAQAGTIDALEWGNLTMMVSHGFHEVTKYWTMPGLGKVHCAPNFVVNLDTWKKLPDDLKYIVESAFRRSSITQYARLQYSDVLALEKAKKAGVKIAWWDQNEQEKWTKTCMTVWDDLAKSSPEASKMIQILKDYCKKTGYIK